MLTHKCIWLEKPFLRAFWNFILPYVRTMSPIFITLKNITNITTFTQIWRNLIFMYTLQGFCVTRKRVGKSVCSIPITISFQTIEKVVKKRSTLIIKCHSQSIKHFINILFPEGLTWYIKGILNKNFSPKFIYCCMYTYTVTSI